jgi:3-hydroxymyristoyl/3-hydroxydecanoyl-(acyl carrier protein) dehydratase
MTAIQTGLAHLTIASDHPAFAGHFPGLPIVPGVVLLDEALCAIGSAIGTDLSACRISSIKFLSPVHPGEPVSVSYEISGTGAIRFDILSDERRVATGSLRMPEAG